MIAARMLSQTNWIKKLKFATLLTFLMALSLLPIAAFAAVPVSLDLVNGPIVITATGYKQGQGDAAEEIPYTGAYAITQSNAAAVANTITVSGTHSITLSGVNIDTTGAGAAPISITGTVEMTLEGSNTVASADNFAGVQVEAGAELTITQQSTGSLTSTGGRKGAGIGGGNGKNAGVITIDGGTINATSGANDPNTSYSGAGIGGGNGGNGGTITINGGIVTANGNRNGAGIGGGYTSDGGTITINGGQVKAYSVTKGGSGIGAGHSGDGGIITITGGNVEATGTEYSAGIGGSSYGDSGIITITGGNVKASSNRGPGIGTGESAQEPSATDKITISGKDTVVEAYGGGGSAAIGGGWNACNPEIYIDGATVYAYGRERGAGIGAGQFRNSYPITIVNGANVTAIGGDPGDDDYFGSYGGGAGIGSGPDVNEVQPFGTITISDSTVYAKGGSGHKDSTAGGGAGIGSAGGGDSTTGLSGGGTIIITNSSIEAIGGDGGMQAGGGAGIGGGSGGGISGDITITGGSVKAVGGNGFAGGTGTGAGAGIGGGDGGGIGNMSNNTLVPATISISGVDLTATGGKAVGGEADGSGLGVGTNGSDVPSSNVSVSSGIYSDIPLNYIASGSDLLKLTTAAGETAYVVGDSVKDAAADANSGDSLEVLQGTPSLEIKAGNVSVTNATNGIITVNGEEVLAGETLLIQGYIAPQTGDRSNLLLWAAMLLLSGMGLVIIGKKKTAMK